MVNYKIDEKNRTVKCVLIDRTGYKVRKSVGVAVCSPNDKFDVEYGKKLAFLRARQDEVGKNIGLYSEKMLALENWSNEVAEYLNRKIVKQRVESDKIRESIKALENEMYNN